MLAARLPGAGGAAGRHQAVGDPHACLHGVPGSGACAGLGVGPMGGAHAGRPTAPALRGGPPPRPPRLLAAAGLKRLRVEHHAILPLPTDQMLPAVGQAALGLEIAADQADLKDAVAALDDPATHQAVLAERSMLRALRGGCLAPVAALASCRPGRITLRGAVFDLDGSRSVQTTAESVDSDPIALGKLAARLLISGGASNFISPLRPDPSIPGGSA